MASHEEKGQHSAPGPTSPRRQSQRRLKSDEIEQLVAGHRDGMLVNEIAHRFGVSRTTVIGHVTRRGLARRHDDEWTPTELAAAADLYASGCSLAEVGELFGLNKSTVATRFRRTGLTLRPPRMGMSRRQWVGGSCRR